MAQQTTQIVFIDKDNQPHRNVPVQYMMEAFSFLDSTKDFKNVSDLKGYHVVIAQDAQLACLEPSVKSERCAKDDFSVLVVPEGASFCIARNEQIDYAIISKGKLRIENVSDTPKPARMKM